MSKIIIPSHLPEKLTISFPIWGIYDTPETTVYKDTDRFMREHRERGFNCVRFDDGAGLSHDLSGKRRGPVELRRCFGYADSYLRQFCAGTGPCDTMERLLSMLRSAEKYDMYLILSSWFYLHTFWMVKDKNLTDELFAIPPHDRFMRFAEFLDYILTEIEAEHLENRIAFCEIFNEADGLLFAGGYGDEKTISIEEQKQFVADHDEALLFLEKRHPEILFAYDSSTTKIHSWMMPEHMQVFNFHSYYAWDIYSDFEHSGAAEPFFIPERHTKEEARRTREGVEYGMELDWFDRAWFYPSLDLEKYGKDIDQWFNNRFESTYEDWIASMERGLSRIQDLRQKKCPDLPVVMGEGVSYIGRVGLNWEENNPKFIEMLEYQQKRHRELGFWGTVVRTCCGPEDNIWTEHPETLLRLNETFSKGPRK